MAKEHETSNQGSNQGSTDQSNSSSGSKPEIIELPPRLIEKAEHPDKGVIEFSQRGGKKK